MIMSIPLGPANRSFGPVKRSGARVTHKCKIGRVQKNFDQALQIGFSMRGGGSGEIRASFLTRSQEEQNLWNSSSGGESSIQHNKKSIKKGGGMSRHPVVQ